ncbi:MAG TPA: hypothetical protein VFH25_03485 [Nitrososphaeraceae archaeon]|nr:hypothetical protein [Nitrososphaeraceae archaeon]
MKMVALKLASILSAGIGLLLLSTIHVSAQPLVPSSPTGTLTDGVNISINPEEPLPANGTVSLSTERVTDTDMNILPPEGVTVVIENDTITVTNQTVDIETVEEENGDETEEDEETEENGADEGGDEGEGDDEGNDEGGGPAVPF